MLEVTLFGPFQATFEGTPLPRPQRLRTAGLWAYLLLNAGTPIARERAAFVLWPDLHEDEARAELRRHLHWLARYLREHTGLSGLLLRDQGRVGWAAPSGEGDDAFSSDVGAFDRGYARIVAALRGRDEVRRADVVDAIGRQRGELLSDMWEDWVEPFRRRYRSELEHLLELLFEIDEAAGEFAAALATGRRLLELDRFREERHRALMRLHAAAGDRAAAAHQFHECRTILREQLDVEPMPETLALYRSILGGAPAAGSWIGERQEEPTAGPSARRTGAPPLPPTSFVGRADDVARLNALLARHRLVTLAGPGGIGKTRLAIEVAARAAKALELPVRWVDLTGVPPGADPTAFVAAAVDDAADGPDGPRGAPIDRILDRLGGARMLLALDGAEHVLPGIATTARRLLEGCPELRILVTSREPLGIDGEVMRRVRPLPVEPDASGGMSEAVALFVERARSATAELALGPDELRLAGEICRALDGMPLAIELAASRIQSRTLGDIRDELVQAGSAADLRPLRPDTAPPSQLGVEGAFEWSYRMLLDDERALLRSVSVFNGAFSGSDVEALARSLGRSDRRPIDVLERLVTTSMIMTVPPSEAGRTARYRMLGPLRAAAWQRAVRAGEAEAIVDAALELVVARAEAIAMELESIRTSDAGSEREPLDEHGLRRSDQRWAMATLDRVDRPDLALRLAAALWRPWSLDGAEAAERAWVDALLERVDRSAAGSAVEPGLVAGARFSAGVLAYQQADPEAAFRHYTAVIEHARRAGDRAAVRMTLDHLAVVHGVLGHPSEAFECCRESIALKAELPAAERADTIAIRGDLHMRGGDLEAASHDYRAALAILRHAPGRRRSLLNVLRGLGIIALRAGRPLDAASYFTEGLELSRSWNDRAGCAVWLNELGCLEMERGHLEAATGAFKEALEIHRTLGAGRRTAMLLNNLGELAIQQDDNVLARYYFMHSLRHGRHAPDDPRRINTLTNLAEAHAYLGEVLRARQTAEEALDLAKACAIPTLTHHARCALGLVALMAGEAREAGAHFGASASGWTEAGERERARLALELGAVAAADHGDLRLAFMVLDAAGGAYDDPADDRDSTAWSGVRSPYLRRALERLLRSDRRELDDDGAAVTPPSPMAAARALIDWSGASG